MVLAQHDEVLMLETVVIARKVMRPTTKAKTSVAPDGTAMVSIYNEGASSFVDLQGEHLELRRVLVDALEGLDAQVRAWNVSGGRRA